MEESRMKEKEEIDPLGKSQAYAAKMKIFGKGKLGIYHHLKK